MDINALIALARTGRDLPDELKGGTWRSYSTVRTLNSGETLCCFIATKAPNSRGSRRGRHERVGFTYRGKEISKARAIELLGG